MRVEKMSCCRVVWVQIHLLEDRRLNLSQIEYQLKYVRELGVHDKSLTRRCSARRPFFQPQRCLCLSATPILDLRRRTIYAGTHGTHMS